MSESHISFISAYLSRPPYSVKVLHLFAYGSRVYGVASVESDYDYYVVVDSHKKSPTTDQLVVFCGQDELNLNVVNLAQFEALKEDHAVGLVECLQTPDLLSGKRIPFKVDKTKLRHSFSEKASNSWVKAKKKIEQGDIRIGQKSLFHSLRILMFGIQLARLGRVDDFKQANGYLEDILSQLDYAALKEKYQPVYNALSSEFKTVAPK